MPTLVLTQSEVRSVLTMEKAVPAVEEAFAALGRGQARMPAKVYLQLPEHAGDFRAMPALAGGAVGLKWVNCHPENPVRHGLPCVVGMYILSDPATALPLAVMDATYLTAVRTGAAAGVATRALARPDARTVGFIGCGAQAPTVLSALRVALEREIELFVFDRATEAAERFAAEAGATSVAVEAAAGCDVVCTMTPSREPVVAREWVRPGAHINALGADGPGKQELDVAILKDAKVIIDDLHQAESGGEVNVALARGDLRREDLHAGLGEVIAGLAPGRESEEEITVFDSTGLALQDVAVARVVYEEARARGLGLSVDFLS